MEDLDIEALEEGSPIDITGTPVIEAVSQVVVPKKGGVIREDGSVRLSIIRPCVSRGRRIRGLPPYYSPQMLAENAQVFRDWPMFVDHLPPEVGKTLQRKGRSVLDLGGRIAETAWDPNLTFTDDAERGFERGGVVGTAFPTEAMKRIIEADPLMMRSSINAYPKSAVVGRKGGTKVALIEGILREPTGSVDWVVRAGAGGQVLTEDEAQLVSILESFYADPQMDLATLTNEQLLEHVASRGLNVPTTTVSNTSTPVQIPSGVTLTEEDVEARIEAKLAEEREAAEQAAQEREDRIREEADERAAERIQAVGFQTHAHKLIEQSGLGVRTQADLKARYTILPGADTPAALCVEAREADGDTEAASALDVLTERVNEDIAYVREIISEELGGAAVRGEGPGGEAHTGSSVETGQLREQLADYGIPVPSKSKDGE